MKNTSLKSKVAHGFSLVELLVVIAVIGVIAAIAIPNIGNITGTAKASSDKRNAQNIASVYSAAVAAGANLDAATAVDTLTSTGVTIEDASSPFNGKTFQVKMGATERDAAKAYLDASVNYTPTANEEDDG